MSTWPVPPPEPPDGEQPTGGQGEGPMLQTLGDGSRWLWQDGDWTRVGPPGADQHELRWAQRSLRAMDVAIRRTRERSVDRTDPSEPQAYQRLVRELVDLVDGDDIALLEASEHLAYHGLRDLDRNKQTPGTDRSRQLLQAVEALRGAAHAARDRLARDDPGIRAFREAREAFRNRQAGG